MGVTHILNRIWSIYHSYPDQRAKVRQPCLVEENQFVLEMESCSKTGSSVGS